MPRPKRKRNYERKTTVYKRRKVTKRRRRRARIAKGIFGKTYKQVLRYVDTISIDPGISANMSYHTFSASSAYDPDVTGTGHQPRFFDQIMLHFNHYTVIGAKLKATFQDNGGTHPQAYLAVQQTASATPVITDINTILEMKDTKTRVMAERPNKASVITSGLNNSKWLGQKVLQEDNNSGTASTSPVENIYFQVMAGSNYVGSTDPSLKRVLIEIEYIVIFHEPKEIAGS